MNTYHTLITAWILVGFIASVFLLRINAPYGRYIRPGWGPTVSNRTGWIVMESTVIVTFLSWKPWDAAHWENPSNLMITLFLLHYIHRALIYPFRIRTSGKRMPVAIMLMAMAFNGVNGSLLGSWFAHYANYSVSWYGSLPFIIGIVIFFAGMAVNISSDNRLIDLRRNSTGYQIPYGGFFRFISSPNLFGEILEWSGYALLTWSYPALAFLIWTCANLVPRAIANHHWYQQHFEDYPGNRKILIPFIW